MKTLFQDHFSGHATEYALYRPDYPAELFQYLASRSHARKVAWDCATGNGQAARQLAKYFDRVLATDASVQQIHQAEPAAHITFRVAAAESSGLESSSVDLITVAAAIHWFHFEKFYAEVRRVGKPSSIIAVWTYDLLNVSPEIDRIVHRLYKYVVGPYWPKERVWVEEQYRTIPFPFQEFTTPSFQIEKQLDYDGLVGYLMTWSSVQKYMARHHSNPIDRVGAELQAAWGDPRERRRVVWPLFLRIGNVHANKN